MKSIGLNVKIVWTVGGFGCLFEYCIVAMSELKKKANELANKIDSMPLKLDELLSKLSVTFLSCLKNLSELCWYNVCNDGKAYI